MCGNGLDFERASGRVEWNGQSVSQSVVKSVHQSKAKLFFPMYKKEKEKEKQQTTTYVYVYSPIYPMYYLLYKKFSIGNNMIP